MPDGILGPAVNLTIETHRHDEVGTSTFRNIHRILRASGTEFGLSDRESITARSHRSY